MLIFYKSIPESPKWLLGQQKLTYGSKDLTAEDGAITENPMYRASGNSNNNGLNPEVYEKVYATLKALRPAGYNIDEEIKSILVDVKKDAALEQDITWKEVFSWRKAMIIGCGLMLYQVLFKAKYKVCILK